MLFQQYNQKLGSIFSAKVRLIYSHLSQITSFQVIMRTKKSLKIKSLSEDLNHLLGEILLSSPRLKNLIKNRILIGPITNSLIYRKVWRTLDHFF